MKYDVFISYSHAADGKLAPALQRALQNIARPFFKGKALNIFRDQTDLAATPHLWEKIEEALGQSRYLILLASPDSAKSKWVAKEIDFFLKFKSEENILIALTDGDILWDDNKSDFNWEKTNALPSILEGQFQMEPLFINFKDAKTSDDLSLKNPIFKNKSAALAATIHGKSVRDLVGEDVRILKRNIRLRNTIILTLFILLLGLIYFGRRSVINARELSKEQEKVIIEQEKVVKSRDSLRIELTRSDSLRIAESKQRSRAESALIEAYSNQIGIHSRDRDKVLNRINLAIQAGRPQDTFSYHMEAQALSEEIKKLNSRIDSLQHNDVSN